MKSFSVLAKEELSRSENGSGCCEFAEYGGMLLFGCSVSRKEIKLVTENKYVLGRFTDLCERRGYKAEVTRINGKAERYTAVVCNPEYVMAIINDYALIDTVTGLVRYRIASRIAERECCRRAFVKGAFMAGGTMTDPEKNYNLEIVTPYMGLSKDFSELLDRIGFNIKTVIRKSKYVLYLKNSEIIEDFLSYIGAYKAQMSLINIKIEKEIKNDFNRNTNSEVANLDKTINAAVRQIRAIEIIDKKIGLDNIPEELAEIARLRLKNRLTSMAELGGMIVPPLGKSGVNHRFKKLEEMADRLSNPSGE